MNRLQKARLVILVNVSSEELMDREVLVCPMCGAPARPSYLRAGLSSFVAATVCAVCECVCRASSTFSLDPDDERRSP